jgi:hypothetical protein
MDTVHLSQKHLAARWRVAEATLERWRSDGLGPQYLKINGRVLYRLCEIQEFENASLRGVATNSSQEGYPQS